MSQLVGVNALFGVGVLCVLRAISLVWRPFPGTRKWFIAILVTAAPIILLGAAFLKPNMGLAEQTVGFWWFAYIVLIGGSLQIFISILCNHTSPIFVRSLPLILPTEILASAVPLVLGTQ